MTDIKMGIYRHYKGPLYLVQGLTHDANNEGRICVLYIGLELDKAHVGPRLAVRTLEDFLSVISCEDAEWGMVEIRRFIYLGPVLTEEMI